MAPTCLAGLLPTGLWGLWEADAAGKKCRLVMNFRLSCTWCSADSTAPGPRCAEHRHHQPQTAATNSYCQLVCEISCSLPPGLLLLLLPDSKAWQEAVPCSNSAPCCTSTKTFALFLKMQILKRKVVSFPCVAGVWLEHCTGAGRGMRVGVSVRCWSLPVSCPSLPVDDAKARLFSAILRKWKILSGEIRGGKKASGAQCCRGTYCKHPEKSVDRFAPVLFY